MTLIFKDTEADGSVPVASSPFLFTERSYSVLDALPDTKLDDFMFDMDFLQDLGSDDPAPLCSEASECVVPAAAVAPVATAPAFVTHIASTPRSTPQAAPDTDLEMDLSSSESEAPESPPACERDSEYVPRSVLRTRVARQPLAELPSAPVARAPARKAPVKRGRRQVGRPPKNAVVEVDSETQRARKRNRIAARRNRALRKLRHEDMLVHSAQLAVENDQLRTVVEREAARLADLQLAVRRKYTPSKLAAICTATS